MKINSDKSHFLHRSNSEVTLTFENQKIKNSKFEKWTLRKLKIELYILTFSYTWHLSKSGTETRCNIYDNNLGAC